MSQTTSTRDLLIVGQGIAGSVLALCARSAGYSVRVLDRGHSPSSSLAAAGLVNPFILKRRKLVWKAIEHVQEAEGFYSEWERRLDQPFYNRQTIHRMVHDVAEWNDWKSMEVGVDAGIFHGGMVNSLPSGAQLDAPHGYFRVQGSGWMDVPIFLSLAKDYLIQDDSYSEETFEARRLEISPGAHRYNGLEYRHVIICTGVPSIEADSGPRTPLFGDLPFNPAKGHTVAVRVPGWGLKELIHAAVFVIPLDEDLYRIGSTYSWHRLDEVVEPKEVRRLLDDFESICPMGYEVVKSRAGVRPATKDRRPLIGSLPNKPGCHLFGGLGSRAVMNAPSLARLLLKHIFQGMRIPEEISVLRYH